MSRHCSLAANISKELCKSEVKCNANLLKRDNVRALFLAFDSDREYGDLPKEAVERIEELKALYRLKYRIDKDAQK